MPLCPLTDVSTESELSSSLGLAVQEHGGTVILWLPENSCSPGSPCGRARLFIFLQALVLSEGRCLGTCVPVGLVHMESLYLIEGWEEAENSSTHLQMRLRHGEVKWLAKVLCLKVEELEFVPQLFNWAPSVCQYSSRS